MHLIVILLGFTGVLGKLISCGSGVLVWYRMLIAFLFLLIYVYVTTGLKISKKHLFNISLIGFIVAGHCYSFESIKGFKCISGGSLYGHFVFVFGYFGTHNFKTTIHFQRISFGVVVLFAIGLATSRLDYKLGLFMV